MKIAFFFAAALWWGVSAQAFTIEDNPFAAPPGYEPLEVTSDAISWEVFATTNENMICEEAEEGYEICEIKPEYGDAIRAYDGKHVTLMGYMFPLTDSVDGQTNFLIGPYPLTCPFEYHSPPSQMVEVMSDEAVEFSFDPIKVTGRFEVKYNKETGVFYYLHSF